MFGGQAWGIVFVHCVDEASTTAPVPWDPQEELRGPVEGTAEDGGETEARVVSGRPQGPSAAQTNVPCPCGSASDALGAVTLGTASSRGSAPLPRVTTTTLPFPPSAWLFAPQLSEGKCACRVGVQASCPGDPHSTRMESSGSQSGRLPSEAAVTIIASRGVACGRVLAPRGGTAPGTVAARSARAPPVKRRDAATAVPTVTARVGHRGLCLIKLGFPGATGMECF